MIFEHLRKRFCLFRFTTVRLLLLSLTATFVWVAFYGFSGETFAQNSQPRRLTPGKSSKANLIQGKNVGVYLEDADFGIQAPQFEYDTKRFLIDIRENHDNVDNKTNDNANRTKAKSENPIRTLGYTELQKEAFSQETQKPNALKPLYGKRQPKKLTVTPTTLNKANSTAYPTSFSPFWNDAPTKSEKTTDSSEEEISFESLSNESLIRTTQSQSNTSIRQVSANELLLLNEPSNSNSTSIPSYKSDLHESNFSESYFSFSNTPNVISPRQIVIAEIPISLEVPKDSEIPKSAKLANLTHSRNSLNRAFETEETADSDILFGELSRLSLMEMGNAPKESLASHKNISADLQQSSNRKHESNVVLVSQETRSQNMNAKEIANAPEPYTLDSQEPGVQYTELYNSQTDSKRDSKMAAREWTKPVLPQLESPQRLESPQPYLTEEESNSSESDAEETDRKKAKQKETQGDNINKKEKEQKELAEKPQSKGSQLGWSLGKFTVTPYGYINLSAAWESQRTAAGDYCVYAQSPQANPASDRSAFYMDPRSSRFGVKIDGPGFKCWDKSYTRAVFECDFQGKYEWRNRSDFLMRKAYLELGDECTKFLFGQDWEIVAPLYPNIFNYPAGSGVGNLGYRRAMARVDRKIGLGCDSSTLWQFAVCDNTVRDSLVDGSLTASGLPVFQGRVSYTFGERTLSHRLPITFGVSGQYGEQKADYHTAPIVYGKSHKTWVVCLDIDIPITKKLRVQSEWYTGENLSNLEGGIIQGVDSVLRDSIRCRGGWVCLGYQWTKKMKTNVGFSIEDPYNQDLRGTGTIGGDFVARTYSHSIFGNVMYNWSEAFMTGIELSQWKTNWQQYDSITQTTSYLKPGEPFRIECVARYTF